MSEANRGTCPTCQTDQQLKKDGTVYKHGECLGAGQMPVLDPLSEEADDGLDWRDDVPELSAPEPNRVKPLPPVPAVQDGPVRDLGGAKAYAWQMTVKGPAIYLGDVDWHHENGKLAVIETAAADYTVTGEPQWDGVVAGGSSPGTVLLTYLVPVAG